MALVPDGGEAGALRPLVPRVKVLGQVDVGRVGALQGHRLRQGGDAGVASLGSAEHLQVVDLEEETKRGFNHFSSARLPPSLNGLETFHFMAAQHIPERCRWCASKDGMGKRGSSSL